MKKYVLVSIGSICGFVLAIIGYVYFFHLLPMKKEQQKIISYISVIASEFLECIYEKEGDQCRKYADDNIAKGLASDEFVNLREKLRSKLGKRISAEVVPESFSLSKWAGVQGSSMKVTVTFNAIYENDPFAKDYFNFVSGSDGKILVQKFHVDSIRFKD